MTTFFLFTRQLSGSELAPREVGGDVAAKRKEVEGKAKGWLHFCVGWILFGGMCVYVVGFVFEAYRSWIYYVFIYCF